MSGPAVVFDHVSKKFRLGERHNSIRDLVPSLVRRALNRQGRSRAADQEFWAVQDVSFEVPKGRALGIIGPNGAGKSTTLKLLTRILKPTMGHCEVHGRVGALIEIAAGFHPDLTGRENIYLQGAIMGMRRAEITRHLDEIIEFAGVSGFIDTQVKRYSSGMNARLGFAIAAHLEPDVLIIDEVLSVGDMGFQRRCVERMERFKAEGVAIVFVSHNLQAVASLCDRALYLKGAVCAIGEPDDVIGQYVATSGSSGATVNDPDARLTAALIASDGEPARTVTPGTPLTLRVTFKPERDVSDYTVLFRMHRSSDQLIVYSGHFDAKDFGQPVLRGGVPTTMDFAFKAHLTRGYYYLETHVIHNPTQQGLARLQPAANLSVQETRTSIGIADLEVDARIQRAEIQPKGTGPVKAGVGLA
jgi:lipopolysaccharide transport system ATP-binding protein